MEINSPFFFSLLFCVFLKELWFLRVFFWSNRHPRSNRLGTKNRIRLFLKKILLKVFQPRFPATPYWAKASSNYCCHSDQKWIEQSTHRTFQTSHFGPKSNFKHVKHHKKLNSSQTSNCMFQDYSGHITTGPNIEHFRTSYFGPKPNFEHVEHHKKLFIRRLKEEGGYRI